MRSLWPVLAILVIVAFVVAGAIVSNSAPAAARAPQTATVSDYSVPIDVSEADALVPRGFAGRGTLGRFGQGCTVSVVKLTDRAAQVKLVRCPEVDTVTSPSSLKSDPAIAVWVARSALTIR